MSPESLLRLLIISFAPLYSPGIEREASPDLSGFMSAMMTILSAYADQTDISNANILRGARQYNVELTCTHLSQAQLKEKSDVCWASLKRSLGMTGDMSDAMSQILGLSFCVMVLIAKRLTEQSRKHWFAARLNAFVAILGEMSGISDLAVPLLVSCLAINISFSSRHELRKEFFNLYRIMSNKEESKYSGAFEVVVGLLRFAEMAHIPLISEFLFRQNPDLIAMPRLMGPEVSELLWAFKVFEQYDPNDVPFLKLLEKPSRLEALQSKHFRSFLNLVYLCKCLPSRIRGG